MSHIRHTISRSGTFYYNRRVPSYAVAARVKASTRALLEEGRIAPANDDIEIERLLHIGLAYTARLAKITFKCVTHQDRHRVGLVVWLPWKIHLRNQAR